jgi:dUTP pyrophosphatase
MHVQIHRIDKNIPLPQYETEGSFGFDFLAREDTVIAPGEIGLVPSNTIIKCPQELALLILPRSSTYRKTGLVFPHSVGLVDQDYCGPEDEIMIQLVNPRDHDVTIKKGEKVAQGLFVRSPKIEFVEVESEFLGKDSRGGFGSTD